MAQLERAPFEAARRTIDVSGDGTNNAGRDVKLARDEALAKGVAINGLVILSEHPLSWNAEHTNPPGGLDRYYQDNVIGGPGAFVMVAQNFNSFGQAIMNKMIAEIAAARDRRYAALHDAAARSGARAPAGLVAGRPGPIGRCRSRRPLRRIAASPDLQRTLRYLLIALRPLARACSVPSESEHALDSFVCACSCRRTGVHCRRSNMR